MMLFRRNWCTFIHSARNASIDVLGQSAMMPIVVIWTFRSDNIVLVVRVHTSLLTNNAHCSEVDRYVRGIIDCWIVSERQTFISNCHVRPFVLFVPNYFVRKLQLSESNLFSSHNESHLRNSYSICFQICSWLELRERRSIFGRLTGGNKPRTEIIWIFNYAQKKRSRCCPDLILMF